MNLKPGTELFKVVLGDGTSFNASDMNLINIKEENLQGDEKAVKGSDRCQGKSIIATFQKGNLQIEWSAVLRDGSHYLRTEIHITAHADQAMQSITPMT